MDSSLLDIEGMELAESRLCSIKLIEQDVTCIMASVFVIWTWITKKCYKFYHEM